MEINDLVCCGALAR